MQTMNIALVAHDNMKSELIEWAKANSEILEKHNLIGTGTTGQIIENELNLVVTKLHSGPLGGDQQLGALIAENKIDIMVFFWDPLQPQPHDPDVKALLRLTVVWNIPVANNRATADFIFSSYYMTEDYKRKVPDFSQHLKRKIQ